MEQTISASAKTKQHSFYQLYHHLNQRIIGQEKLTLALILSLLADGHLLVEGAPGLAKTSAIKELAACIEGSFQRIQFTPDLLPADLTGTDIFRPQTGSFEFAPGPLFHEVLLADEINRAPAKVQSALLEAMAEKQVSIGGTTYGLPELFLVMATQNPLEQEGTYPLPEAQLDRFLMHVKIDYPNEQAERKILQINRFSTTSKTHYPKISQAEIFRAREAIQNLYMSPALEEYIVQLVLATRKPENIDPLLAEWIRFGASPRATIGLDKAAKAHAWIHGRDYVSPKDIHAVVYDILRHRLILSFEAKAQGVTCDQVITVLLKKIAVP